MVLLDLLGRRWTLRIIWELRDSPKRFRELQESIGASPTIINKRVGELRDAQLVTLDEDCGYALTPLGIALLSKLMPLSAWADRWSAAVLK